MSRYARKNVTINDLMEKISKCSGIEYDPEECCLDDHLIEIVYGEHRNMKVVNDLGKIEFDCENCGSLSDICESFKTYEMINGFPVAWCYGGGDWEVPVAFCLYIGANGELRGYVPEDGNVYNHKLKIAFGNNGDMVDDAYDMDADFAIDPEDYDDENVVKEVMKHGRINPDLMREDVRNRIIVK